MCVRTGGGTPQSALVTLSLSAVRVCGYHGYPPEHLRQLPFEQRYDDGEANTGGDQVKKGGLWTDRPLGTRHTRTTPSSPSNGTCACLKVCMTKMVRPNPKM